MSRFFAHSDSESESSSSEEEQTLQRPSAIASAFTISDDEDETKRVVRSAKEKRYEDLTEIIKQIRNHKKIKDMSKLLTGFENLSKAHVKAKTVIEKEEQGVTPKFYIRCLVELEDFVTELWEDKEGRKAMSKNNSKSLTTLRQKLRKYNREYFEAAIEDFRQNPVEDEKEEEPGI
ncbi:Eukaryotic translation initiation factor 3 subunit C [Nymphon striatum]|nr:Eukaryotic translation initiation factor 3 subunit C [Nymphon striatum]